MIPYLKRRNYHRRVRHEIERPRRATLWGKEYQVTPAFVPTIFGDGLRLMAIQTFDDRPDYYVMRVPSCLHWGRDPGADGSLEFGEWYCDNESEIMEAICAEYGERCGCDDDQDCDSCNRTFPEMPWMASGVTWWEEYWPGEAHL